MEVAYKDITTKLGKIANKISQAVNFAKKGSTKYNYLCKPVKGKRPKRRSRKGSKKRFKKGMTKKRVLFKVEKAKKR